MGDNPVILIGDNEPVAVIDPAELVAVYPVAPIEAVKDTSAELLDDCVAETSVGALGNVTMGADSEDDVEVPPKFVAVTVNV